MATIIGTFADEEIIGTEESDVIDHGGGSDLILGDFGNDTVIFHDNSNNFTLQTLGGITRIRGSLSAVPQYADLTSILLSVEIVSFSNINITLTTTFDNVIFGTIDDEIITGTSGNDTIDHGGGADIVEGGSGIDTLIFYDDSSNYTISTVSGITRIVGSPTAVLEYASKEVVVSNVEHLLFLDTSITLGSSGSISGTTGNDILFGTNWNDTISPLGGSDLINGGEGIDTVAIFDNSSNFNIVSLSGVTHLVGKSSATAPYRNTESVLINTENIKFQNSTVALPTTPINVIIGGSGSEVSDIIDHLGGSGSIDGLGGSDTLLFFDIKENYIISTVAGITKVFGKPTADYKYAMQEVVLTSIEQLRFLNGTIAIGGDGLAQSQNPQYIFDPNIDPNDPWLVGTSGDDIIDHMGGEDWIDGGTGVDKVLFFDSITNYTVRTLAGVTHLIGEGTAFAPYQDSEVLLVNVETLIFNDATLPLAPTTSNLLLGTNLNEQLTGTIFDDVIDHMGGGDFIDGSAGYDTVLFFDSVENFQITTLNGVTRILGKASASEAYRGFETVLVNVEKFLFSEVAVTPTTRIITGTESEGDLLVGTSNDDIIDPVGGGDWIYGGAGTDTVIINDKINNFTFWTLHGVTWMFAEDTEATNELYRHWISIMQQVEKVQFLDGTKFLETAATDAILGSGEDETLTGTAGNDVIDHVGGNDFIDGGAGNDIVLFFETFDNMVVTRLGNRFRVLGKDVDNKDLSAYEGKIAIIDNVETLQFLDRTVTLTDDLQQFDTDISGNDTSGFEHITGTEGKNIIDHLGGSDRIDGGGGIDTLLFWDSSTNFTVLTLYGVTHVLGNADALAPYRNTEAILVGVEDLIFTDYTQTLDASRQVIIFGSNAGGTETLTATAGNDVIDHLGGSDNIDGGTGFDTLLFFDSIDNFTITKLAGMTKVLASSEANPAYSGTEATLLNIERLVFIDGVINNSVNSGTADNDLLASSNLSETFDGGSGIDTVTYSGTKANYTLSQSGTDYVISRGTAETDLLLNIERLKFLDTRLAIDLEDGEAANNTVRMLGAAFGNSSISDEVLVGVGLYLFDNGWTMDQVAELVVELDNFKLLDNRAFAQTLCTNIGFNDVDFAEQMLDLGVERSDLLRAAAEYYTNEESINLVGLQQTGVEYAEWV